MWRHGLDLFDSGTGEAGGSCEYGNELLGTINAGVSCLVEGKESAPWSEVGSY
jgi:hypothetical protein